MRQLVAFLLLSASAVAQPAPDGSPLWIAERLFDPDGFPEMERFAASRSLPQDSVGRVVSFAEILEPGVRTSLRLVYQDSTTALVAIRMEAAENGEDWYLHFVRDSERWSFQRLRSAAQPGWSHLMAGVLSLWEDVREDAAPQEAFWTRAETEFEGLAMALGGTMTSLELARMFLGPESDLSGLDTLLPDLPSMRLTLASDSALKAHFQKHRSQFDRISESFAADAELARVDGADASSFATMLRDLAVTSARRSESHIVVLVGGFLDDEVGYIYVPDGSHPTEGTGVGWGNYIYIEALGDGWYLYRAT